MKTAFVTGGTGFVGLNLIDALNSAGWSVTALHRPGADTTELAALGAKLAPGDIVDAASLSRAIPEGVDAVFHVAGSINVWRTKNDEQTRINVDGTRNMVEAALAAKAKRFVHVSTLSTFGDQDGPISEDTPQHAAGSWINYERTKWQAEQEVKKGVAKGLHGVIVCPCAIVGPRDRHGWARLYHDIALEKVPAIPPGGGTFNDVRAVAEGLIAAAEKGRAGEIYILSGERLSFQDIFNMAAAEFGVAAPKKIAPKALLYVMGWISDMVGRLTGKEPDMTPEMASIMCGWKICNSTKAERELGYRPRPIKQALHDSIAWLQERDLLPKGRGAG